MLLTVIVLAALTASIGGGIGGILIDRAIRNRRKRERLAWREQWREQWLVGVDCPYGPVSEATHHPTSLYAVLGEPTNLRPMPRHLHDEIHGLVPPGGPAAEAS